MPLPASWVAVENATSGTFAACATGFTASTSLERSGPRMSFAPPSIAECAAAAAAVAVPPLSRTKSSSRSLPVSNSAICAASSIACPSAALGPESGSSSPTSTWVPAGATGCSSFVGMGVAVTAGATSEGGAVAAGGGGCGFDPPPSNVQPASAQSAAARNAAVRKCELKREIDTRDVPRRERPKAYRHPGGK